MVWSKSSVVIAFALGNFSHDFNEKSQNFTVIIILESFNTEGKRVHTILYERSRKNVIEFQDGG